MLSAASGAGAGQQQHHHKPLGAGGIGVLNNDAILTAYLGQSFGAGEWEKEGVCVCVCVFGNCKRE